jgi:hypothetical protein
MNGTRGTIQATDKSVGRYQVLLDDGVVIKVKWENVESSSHPLRAGLQNSIDAAFEYFDCVAGEIYPDRLELSETEIQSMQQDCMKDMMQAIDRWRRDPITPHVRADHMLPQSAWRTDASDTILLCVLQWRTDSGDVSDRFLESDIWSSLHAGMTQWRNSTEPQPKL